MTTASDLRTLVTIRHQVAGTDALGQPAGTWETLAAVRAHVRHAPGAEMIKAAAEVSSVRASVRIRKRADVTAAMRVMIGAVEYDIAAVAPAEDGRTFMDLVCEVTA
jgi:SPP1 family predicted phage head-tail adaptor